MFGIGESELVIILIFAFLIFGPDKLPGMGRTVGRALRQFREAQDSVTKVVQSEIVDPLNSGMNEPAAKKRADKARAALAQDADREDASSDGDAPTKTETFAERRARLQAEREAQLAEREAQQSVEESATQESEPEVAAEEPETAKTPDLASLYAMKPASTTPARDMGEAEAGTDAGKEE